MTELFKAFFRNPFQVKYLPVFACLLMAAVFTPITHAASSVIVPVILAAMQVPGADKPVRPSIYACFIVGFALFASFAIYLVFCKALMAALISGTVALLPLALLYTRKLEEKIDVQ